MEPEHLNASALPSYSAEPSDGEERLFYSLTARPWFTPTGTFLKQGPHGSGLSLVLRGQEDDTRKPSFGRGAVVSGVVNLDGRKLEGLKKVELKFNGSLEIISQGVSLNFEDLLDISHTLWDANSSDGAPPKRESGNYAFEFSMELPMTTMDNDRMQLPPSMSLDDRELSVMVKYGIDVVCHRRQRGKWGMGSLLGSGEERFTVEFDYRPRSRPTRPLDLSSQRPFLSSLKFEAEEWHQSQSDVKWAKSSMPSQENVPIICDFFTPETKILSVTDTIPFHIQLGGATTYLADFVPPSYDSQDHARLPSRPKPATGGSKTESNVRVQLVRQVLAFHKGRKLWTNVILGEGELWQVFPEPSYSSASSAPHGGEEEVDLHWDGFVKCEDAELARFGSFNVGKLVVKDFILLTVSPSDPASGSVKIPVSITLVTDSGFPTGRDDVPASE